MSSAKDTAASFYCGLTASAHALLDFANQNPRPVSFVLSVTVAFLFSAKKTLDLSLFRFTL